MFNLLPSRYSRYRVVILFQDSVLTYCTGLDLVYIPAGALQPSINTWGWLLDSGSSDGSGISSLMFRARYL